MPGTRRETGTIVTTKPDHGYAFIKRDSAPAGPHLFAHICDLHDRASRRDFERGMRVCYRVGKTGRGRRAIDIVVFS